jgi:F-type H+-transporting ATPase subunit a
MARIYRSKFLVFLLGIMLLGSARLASAAPEGGDSHGGGHEATAPVFEPKHGTWFNLPARTLLASPEEKAYMAKMEKSVAAGKEAAKGGITPTAEQLSDSYFKGAYEAAKLQKEGKPLTQEQEYALKPHYVAKYDFLIFTPVLWALLALILVGAARKGKIRPQGKATSSTSIVESMVEGFQNYLIGVMGEKMARKYLPLIASFFFTILVSNYVGLIPGMLAPSAMPAIPIALAIVAFFATHLVAIKETGLKAWFMHFVGEPVWLAPLNFPLHLVGELIKPISLSLRLLCNIFGEEQVVATLIGLAIMALPIWLPIPFQLPMLFLGVLFGFLQALVFSTLLAIYISVLSTHHDEHGGHEHTEHAHDSHGNTQIVGVASASPVA